MSRPNLPQLKTNPPGMRRVDRMDWKVGCSFKSYGVKIGIRTNDPAALAKAQKYLPADSRPKSFPTVDRLYSIMIASAKSRPGARRFHHIYGDDIRVARAADLELVFNLFESDLRLFVAEYAKHRVFVHAGVVGWKGRAIVIPGRSYSGKSTLVAELVRAGATYYSDEYAVFDSRGRVHPFSKPIEIREEGSLKQSKIDVVDLGGQSGTKPLPVGLVLMTRYQSGAQWRPRKITPGKGVLELLFNTVSARRDPEQALSTLQQVTAQASVLKGARGNASAVVPAILKRMNNGFRP